MFLTNEEKDDYAARNISYECHGEMTHNCVNTISQCVVNIVPTITHRYGVSSIEEAVAIKRHRLLS